jgi:hypothetical protein
MKNVEGGFSDVRLFSGNSIQVGLVLSWWGRWDLDPGSPTPQAGILNHSRQNCATIHRFCKLDDDPNKANNTSLIIKTLLQAQNNGKAKKKQ